MSLIVDESPAFFHWPGALAADFCLVCDFIFETFSRGTCSVLKTFRRSACRCPSPGFLIKRY